MKPRSLKPRHALCNCFALSVVLVAATAGTLAAQQPWIHLEVTEKGDEGSQVRVNLPLALAEVAIAMIPDKITNELDLSEHDVTIGDLRALWQQIKESGDAEFVSVESKDENVRIARAGDLIRIRVEEDKSSDEQPAKRETVEIDVPMDVVDALLSGEGDTVDLAANLSAAVAQLSKRRGDVIRVNDGESKVRIWIDERS